MRRTDREISSLDEILDILNRCDTIRIGINTTDYPYIVPMSFGAEIENGQIVIYLHCAKEGRKIDLLQADNRVCLEADLYYKVERTEKGGITARYESVIGTGKALHLTEKADKITALKSILAHYKESGFPVTSCSGLDAVEIYRIPLDQVTGKRSLS